MEQGNLGRNREQGVNREKGGQGEGHIRERTL